MVSKAKFHNKVNGQAKNLEQQLKDYIHKIGSFLANLICIQPLNFFFENSAFNLTDCLGEKEAANRADLFTYLTEGIYPFPSNLRYTQSQIIRTDSDFLGNFKHRALGSSNLSTTSKNLRTTRAQIFKAKNQVLLPF